MGENGMVSLIKMRLTMLQMFTIGMNAAVILVRRSTAQLRKTTDLLCSGKSQIRMGPPPLGRSIRNDSKGEHDRFRCKAALRGSFHIHSTVARLLLLQTGRRQWDRLVYLGSACQHGVQYLHWHCVHLLGNLALRVSRSAINIVRENPLTMKAVLCSHTGSTLLWRTTNAWTREPQP